MNHFLCITGFRHDLRLTRQLNAFELRHFFLLLDFAGGLRDRTYIPAKKREELRLTLGFGSSDQAREKLDKRLRRYHDLELIRLYDDGSILLTFLLDQEDEEERREDDAPADRHFASYPLGGGSHNTNSQNGSGGSNGSGITNGSGAHSGERRSGPERRRQSGRVYSQNPDTVRKREEYWAARNAEEGAAAPETVLEPEVFGENLRGSASKPPAMSGEFAPEENKNLRAETSENLREKAEVSLAGASAVTTVVRGSKDSYNSDYSAPTVARDQNLQKTSEAKPPQTSDLSGPIRPLPRPQISPQMYPAQREADVKAVMAAVGDGPAWRNQWAALWRHCYKSEMLRCWDEGFAILVWRQRVSPVSGPGAVRRPSVFLRGTIWALLKDADAPYVPASQAGGVTEAADPAEAEEARRSIQETRDRWAAEEAAGITVTSPLKEVRTDDIVDAETTALEDLYAEREEE